MAKRYLILMLATMVLSMVGVQNVLAQSLAGTFVQISDYEENVVPGFQKFKEPVVTVVTKNNEGIVTNIVTDRFDIRYLINGKTTDDLVVNSRGAKVTQTAKGASVEYLFGDVLFGGAEDVTIQVVATPKSGWELQYPSAPFTTTYTVTVDALEAALTFAPAFPNSGSGDYITFDATAVQAPWSSQYMVKAQSTALPSYKMSYTNTGGVVSDITDRFDVSISYIPMSGMDGIVTYSDNKLTFAGSGATRYDTQEAAQTAAGSMTGQVGTLIYTFTPKLEFAGLYTTINKDVAVSVAAVAGKQQLHLFLNRDIISEENVTTDANGVCTVHVYKYGWGDHSSTGEYMYFMPNPVLMTQTGVNVPMRATRGTGAWGDFEYLYEVLDGDDDNPGKQKDTDGTTLGTYYDNCEYSPFWNVESVVSIPAGKKVLLQYSDDKFQVKTGNTGLVKVAVYATLSTEEWQSADLKALYEPIKDGSGNPLIMKDQYGSDRLVYTEPVYFYIDVMKRVPELIFSPDPSTMTFVKGDKIDMKSRFLVSGHIDDNSNGVEGWLLWGANTDATGPSYDETIGHQVDHFAYTFFISERNKSNIILHDWPYYGTEQEWLDNGGDRFSYVDYQTVAAGSKVIGQPIMESDKVMIGGVLTEVTAGNIETIKASHPTLQAGDKEKGITYYSTRGYGEKFEIWTMEFAQTGKYEITYTICPYNHPRWDKGTGDAGTVTYTYDVVESVPTKIDLSYTYTTTPKCEEWNFAEPVAKVVVPSQGNYDVTRFFDLSYDIPSALNTTGDAHLDVVVLDEKGFAEHTGDFSVYYLVTERNGDQTIKSKEPILAINKATGEVYVGCAWTGNVVIRVSGTKKQDSDSKDQPYEVPDPAYYTIRIIDETGLAKYEIISACRTDDPCGNPHEHARFADVSEESGRFHFIQVGELYGGTVYRGVPGIDMTLGAAPLLNTDVANWFAEATSLDVDYCCAHENATYKPVAVQADNVVIDDEGIPTGGTFYKFTPTTNGYLSVDANWIQGEIAYLVSKNSRTGEIVTDEILVTSATARQGDLTFAKALIAGETYYLYNRTAGFLRLHGFAYQPAFVFDRNTTKEQSLHPIEATTFMNGLSSGIPTIISSTDGNVSFSIPDADEQYMTVNATNGAVDPKKMTVQDDGSISYVTVTATIESPDKSLGACVKKTATYKLRIIDIPSYVVGQYSTVTADNKYHAVTNQTPVTTTNIPTAITMTFGGWKSDYHTKGVEDDYSYEKGPGSATKLTDKWENKSSLIASKNNEKDESGSGYDAYIDLYGSSYTIDGSHASPASRIGSELADYDLTYNKPIDGFYFFTAASQNPIDERGYGPLTAAAGNVYHFGSGTEKETSYKDVELNDTTIQSQPEYNSTYRLPCKGAYVKFEPEESGIVMVYLVQNGSVDYHTGLAGSLSGNNYQQVRWRPLYITDETGKPVEMVNDFGNAANYMTNYEDAANTGSFTLGISRCNPIEPVIDAWFNSSDPACVMEPGCSFDFRQFRGTPEDRKRLLKAWPAKGERESIIRLDDGGFALAHKAYVRYSFKVMAGKSYFVFQPGSKFEFGGFSFVPDGYPDHSKYGLNWKDKPDDAKDDDCMSWHGDENVSNQETTSYITWMSPTALTAMKQENYNITVKDGAYESAAARKVKFNSWTSICLPFSVSQKQCKELFGDDYVLLTAAGVDAKGQIHFERHAHEYIEAGRPYLLKPHNKGDDSDTKDIDLVFHNVTIENDIDVVNPSRFNVEAQEYTFKGVYNQETMPKGSIVTGGIGSESGLYTFTKDYPIGGYRAYYYLPSGAPQTLAKKLFAFFDFTSVELELDDTPTGIVCVSEDGDVQMLPKNVGVYTINGQKLGEGLDALKSLKKGIYIVNGSKFLVK